MRARRLPLAACVALSAGLACEPETLVIARLDPGAHGAGAGGASTGSAGQGGASNEACVTNADCSSTKFCARLACGAPSGTCQARPSLCGAEPNPMCGCDGVSYFNDCLRRAAGENAASMGECDVTGLQCDATTPCPPSARCAVLLPNQPDACEPEAVGKCWVIPADCGTDPPGDRFEACDGSVSCAGTCDAIQAEAPFRRVDQCGS